MANQLKLRGGTTLEHSSFVGAMREVTVDTDKKTLVVHDGGTVGGHPLAKESHTHTPASIGAEPANANIQTHIASTGNPHGTTAAQVGAVPTSDVVATPTANKILKLDGSGKLPASITGDAATVGGYAPAAFATAGHTHTNATTGAAGFMSAADKSKLDGIATGATNYTHPTGDGNLHVPATGTGNNGKVLKAGSTAGSAAWGSVDWTEVTSKPSSMPANGGNADTLDTYHANTGTTANTIPVRDANGKLPGSITGDAATLGGNAASYYAVATHSHSAATTGAAGFMSATDKSKLDGIAAGANNYTHPTGDGNLHVPATSTTNNGKVLKAGATAGSLSWSTIDWTEVTNKPTTMPANGGNADTVDTYHASTSVTANAIPVRDSNGKLPGSITGDAATVGGRTIYSSTADPVGGVDGDIWLKYS